MAKSLYLLVCNLWYRKIAASGVGYALIAGMIAVSTISAITSLGERTENVLGLATAEMENASSGGGGAGGGGNTPPSISGLADTTIGLNETYGATSFFVSDSETDASLLSLSGSSSNTTLVPNGNIIFGGSGATRTLVITPANGQSGVTTITIVVDDGVETTQDSFVLTVKEIAICHRNLVPGTRCYLDEEEVVFVSNYDPDDGGGSRPLYARHCDIGMTWDGFSCASSRSLWPYNDDNTTGRTDTSVPNNGLSDGKAYTDILVVEDSDTTVVGAQPHQAAQVCRNLGGNWYLPALDESAELYAARNSGDFLGTYGADNYWTSSEQGETTAHFKNMSSGGTGSAHKYVDYYVRCAIRFPVSPYISTILDKAARINETSGPFPFTVSDAVVNANDLVVYAESSNTTLVPTQNINIGGSGENRTFSITPASGQSGVSTITMKVFNGTYVDSTRFYFYVRNIPVCSGTLSSGDACIIDDELAVFVSLYDPGDGGGSRALYARPCDEGMEPDTNFNCMGTRESLPWNNGNTSNMTGTSVPDGVNDDGKEFTDILVAEDSHSSVPGIQPHQAAQKCRDYGDEWFLPALNETNELYLNQNVGDFSGTFQADFYWSSSELSSTSARRRTMATGGTGSAQKYVTSLVRCTRR